MKLNFACGQRIHSDWENIDFSTYGNNNVKRVNLLSTLPYSGNYFDVAYSSHFLEHLDKDVAPKVLTEAKRVLKDNGIMRIVVPDLENMAREYLSIMDSEKIDDYKHEWITTEIFDQMVRMRGGGGMLDIFSKIKRDNDKIYADYVKLRIGDDLLDINHDEKPKLSFLQKIKREISKISTIRLKEKILKKYLKFARWLIPAILRDEIFINTAIGERHKWVYDRYSLVKLLESCGFKDIKIMDYKTSDIENFNSYLLDINEDGSAYKGVSSIYVECRK